MGHYTRTNPSTRSRPRLISPRISLQKPMRRRTQGLFKRVILHLIGWPIVLLVLLALLAEVGTLVLLFGEHDYSDRIYPNITIQGLDMSNHTRETANLALQKRYEIFLKNPIELRYGDLSWYPTAQDLGISINFVQAIQQALTIGRTDTRLDNTRTVAAVWEKGAEVPLHIKVDQTIMQGYLLNLAHALDTPSRNADIDLQGANIFVTKAQEGFQVLVDETMYDITAALQSLSPKQVVPLRTRIILPVVRDSDFMPLIARIHELLDEPITLHNTLDNCGNNCTWIWSPAKIASWVNLIRGQTPDGRPTVSIDIDQGKIRQALVAVSDGVRRDGSLPRLSWNEGNLQIMQTGQNGRGLDVALAQSLINKALEGGSRTIDLPTLDIPPPVNESNLATLGIRQVVATGSSSFLHSQQYRITNIRAGARRMHGLLIAPGSTFSFNDHLGTVDAKGGFVQGSAIVNNRTQQEWGGGLCQVSTTMFRAAFWAGLPIVERHEHDFRIGWYEELGEPPGLDAAIYTGWNDLRFVNDTGNWLLIQTWADLDRQRLFITLYGSPSQRKVELSHRILRYIPAPEEPVMIDDPKLPAGTFKQTDWAQQGLDVEVYRVVWQGENIIRRDTFKTHFKPWPNVFVRGTR